VGRLIGALGMIGTIGGAVLLLVFFGVLQGEEQGRVGTLVLALVLLAFGIPALVHRFRDIFS
jgi:nitrate/nitrite transporter NarK